MDSEKSYLLPSEEQHAGSAGSAGSTYIEPVRSFEFKSLCHKGVHIPKSWRIDHWALWGTGGFVYLSLCALQVILWIFLVVYPLIVMFGSESNGVSSWEWVSIKSNATGVIAIGQHSLGIISIGQFARGVFVIGQFGCGLFTIGMIGFGVFGGIGILMITMGPGTFIAGSAGYIIACIAGLAFVRCQVAIIAMQLVSPFFSDNDPGHVMGGNAGSLIVSFRRKIVSHTVTTFATPDY